MSKIPWTWFDYRADLLQWLLMGVGRIAMEWSILEREIEELIRLTADMPIKTGRIATFRMNMNGRLMLADNFIQAHVYNETLKQTYYDEFKAFKKAIDKIEFDRNLVVHGLWDRQGGKWRALCTRGSRKIPYNLSEMEKLSRAVLPKSDPIDADKLDEIAKKIIALSARAVDFCAQLSAALPPSRHKPPQYTRQRHPSPGHKSRK